MPSSSARVLRPLHRVSGSTSLKLQPERAYGVNLVSSYAAGAISINGEEWTGSILLPARGSVRTWPVRTFDELSEAHFQAVLDTAPELVIFGSGTSLRFPRPAWIRVLVEGGVGFETMDTRAACRTYNVLVSEGRQVTAALLLPGG